MNLINLGICIAIGALGIGFGAILVGIAVGIARGFLAIEIGDDD